MRLSFTVEYAEEQRADADFGRATIEDLDTELLIDERVADESLVHRTGLFQRCVRSGVSAMMRWAAS